MSRLGMASARALGVALALTLGVQFVQPHGAAAQPSTPLGKAVCNVSVSGSCPATTTTTSVSAVAGNEIQYNIIYTPSGTTTATVLISDLIQSGQTFVTGSCQVLTGAPATCSYSATPASVSFTVPAAPPNVPETVAFDVLINSGAPSTIYNQATASVNGSPTAPSNTTTVSVSSAPPPSSAVTLTKQVRDVSTGGAYGTAIAANSGDRLTYSLTINNGTGTPLAGATISDTLQAGQSFVAGSCSVACTFNGSTVIFSISSLPTGPYTVTFDVYVITGSGRYVTGAFIPNTASASASNGMTATSNTTTVSVNGFQYVPPSYFPPVISPIVTPSANTFTICGVLSAWDPTSGYFTMNGMTFTMAPYLAPTGIPIAVGANVCVTVTVSVSVQVVKMVVAPNLPAVNYACGTVSPFVAGYNPYPGFQPYPGYNPYPSPGASYGPFPYGNTGMWAYNGPIVMAGYPFPVAPNTYFPFSPTYGNPYCFLMSPQGYVTGTISSVAVAAYPVEDPGVYRVGHTHIFIR